MHQRERPGGPWAAALTPVAARGIDHERLRRHLGWLTDSGCQGAVLFGSTGEAASFSVAERSRALEQLLAGGVESKRLIVGTGCCATADTVALTTQAVEAGCAGVLVIPPYFFKPVTDDGLFNAYQALIEAVDSPELQLYLYHFPELSGVPLSGDLIDRLLEAFPGSIAGIKDSSGDLEHTLALLERFPTLDVFTGDDDLLWPVVKAGGAGSITATANIIPGLLGTIWAALQAGAESPPEAHDLATKVWTLVLENYPVTQAFKACLAHRLNDDAWMAVREPLTALPADAAGKLLERVQDAGLDLRL